MREPNFSSPAQNKAAIVISSTLYDRRALDCTATLPLVNSLTHLAYMTSTSPRIREILASDGGLERLVKILATCHNTDKHSLWKWSLAFQCVVNIGVRGTEAIRTRVVEVGAVHVVLAILENFLRALEQAKLEKEQERNRTIQHIPNSNGNNNVTTNTTTTTTAAAATTTATNNTALSLPTMPLLPQSRSTPVTPSRRLFSIYPPSSNGHTTTTTESTENTSPTTTPTMSLASTTLPLSSPSLPALSSSLCSSPGSSIPFAMPKRRTFLSHAVKTKSKNKNTNLSSIPLLNSLASEAVLHREEDILLSLQLLAYLSKYPHIRQTFHNDHRHNVFSIVEKFTHRIHPQTIIYWAGVIMRNACRKDESQGGIRQCAYMHCGKWERYPREFAKCRRCRKAKYCSKTCQSRAWAEGHRWWCVERTHSSHPPNTISTTTAAATAAVVAAAPPPENHLADTEQIGSLDEVATTTHIPINADETRPLEQQQQQHDHHLQNQDHDHDMEQHNNNHQDPSISDENSGTVGLGLETEEEDQQQQHSQNHQHHHLQSHQAIYQRSSFVSPNANEQHVMNQPHQQQQGHQQQQPSEVHQQQQGGNTGRTTSSLPSHDDTISDRLLPNQQSLLFYHRRRRNSRSAQSLASGSSTEVEVDTTESLQPNQQDLMEID